MTLAVITWLLAILSLYGVVLNIQKRPSCFYIWSVTNAGWVFIDALAGVYAQAALFTIYLGLSLYGAWDWNRDRRRERFVHINL